jgi:phage terminase small subunit
VKKQLSPRQHLFVLEYLVDLNATQAAIRAGYSKKTADVQGPRLLGNVRVKATIAKAMKRREDALIMSRDEVLRELSIIGRADLKNYVEINQDTGAIRAKGFEEMPEGASRALESIQEDRAIKENADGNSTTVYDKTRFKLHDKPRALDMLAKYHGLYEKDNSQRIPPKIIVEYANDPDGAGEGSG